MDMESELPANSILQPFQALQLSATALDFGPEFATNKTPQQFAAAVNGILQLHGGNNKLERLRFHFAPLDVLLPDIHNWIAFAAAKGVEVLELDFSAGFDALTGRFIDRARSFRLPDDFYRCRSLRQLTLSHCEFHPPPDFAGFGGLQSLSLAQVDISADVLQLMVAKCAQLESLSIRSFSSLESINVVAQELRRFAIVESWVPEIEISAPKLQSFIYYGEFAFGSRPESSNVNVPLLEEAFVSSLHLGNFEPDQDFIVLLSEIAHVKILTVCSLTLMEVDCNGKFGDELLPLLLPNLRELQQLVGWMNSFDLECIYSFLRFCHAPLVEKLFIQLPTTPEEFSYKYHPLKDVEEPSGVVFGNLRMIKVGNFKGGKCEMNLMRFLLQRAVVLEGLVLVAPPESNKEERIGEGEDGVEETNAAYNNIDFMTLRQQVSALPKASHTARIILFNFEEDNQGLAPTHKEYYCEL